MNNTPYGQPPTGIPTYSPPTSAQTPGPYGLQSNQQVPNPASMPQQSNVIPAGCENDPAWIAYAQQLEEYNRKLQANAQTPTQSILPMNTESKASLTGVKDKLKKIPVKIILCFTAVVVVVIALIMSFRDPPVVTPAPAPVSKVEPAPAQSTAPQVRTDASIDRVVKPGMTETFGNLLEVYNEMVFPNALSVPEAQPVVDRTLINLGGSYYFRPNRNWTSRLDGNSIVLIHDDGMVAKFIYNKAKRQLKPEDMKLQVFPQFLSGFGVEDSNIVYSEIFYNASWAGLSTRAPAKFNDQTVNIDAGMISCGTEVLSYVIAYYATDNIYPEEILGSLLNTVTYRTSPLTFTPQ